MNLIDSTGWMKRRWPLVQYALDALAWGAAVPLAAAARYDFVLRKLSVPGVIALTALAMVLQGPLGAALGLYRRRYHYGSFDELRALVASTVTVGVIITAASHLFGSGAWVPRSAALVAGFIALVFAAAVRYVARVAEERHLRPDDDASEPVLVFGAGEAGRQVVRSMLRSSTSRLRPVALLDDDAAKARLTFSGIAVEGTRDDLAAVAKRHGATTVLIAVPSASGELLRHISDAAEPHRLKVLVLPPVDQIPGIVSVSDARPVTVHDLLGRHPANIDLESIARYVRGRRVLVTGAGGSIGGELCRQLQRFSPERLVMADRDESGLHATQLSIEGRALLDSDTLELIDLRDRTRVFEMLQRHRPHVVFHAGALKHLSLLEAHSSEAWKTNVVGTRHMLDASVAAGVERFVNVSTDKAADPISVLGSTKRLAERLTASTALSVGLPYVSVRFGNVLGSRGSFLGVFEQQIAAGGPLTVTDPEVSRFFMTVEEAVMLMLQATAIGAPGEVLVLDMGPSVRIADVATQMRTQANRSVPIEYTGLRRGEKLHEVLLGCGEVDDRPNHPLISQVRVPALTFDEIDRFLRNGDRLDVSPDVLRAAAWMGVDDGELNTGALDTGAVVADDLG